MGEYRPHQTTILGGASLALSPAICLLAFYRVILHAVHLTIGTLPEVPYRRSSGIECLRKPIDIGLVFPCVGYEDVPLLTVLSAADFSTGAV